MIVFSIAGKNYDKTRSLGVELFFSTQSTIEDSGASAFSNVGIVVCKASLGSLIVIFCPVNDHRTIGCESMNAKAGYGRCKLLRFGSNSINFKPSDQVSCITLTGNCHLC